MFSVDGLGSILVYVLEGVIGMWNVLDIVSSVLKLPSSCDCMVKLISESVSSAFRSLSILVVNVSWM